MMTAVDAFMLVTKDNEAIDAIAASMNKDLSKSITLDELEQVNNHMYRKVFLPYVAFTKGPWAKHDNHELDLSHAITGYVGERLEAIAYEMPKTKITEEEKLVLEQKRNLEIGDIQFYAARVFSILSASIHNILSPDMINAIIKQMEARDHTSNESMVLDLYKRKIFYRINDFDSEHQWDDAITFLCLSGVIPVTVQDRCRNIRFHWAEAINTMRMNVEKLNARFPDTSFSAKDVLERKDEK